MAVVFDILSKLIHHVHFRNFFNREGGRNSVEFFKEGNEGALFIALKFDSKSVAKEMLNR